VNNDIHRKTVGSTAVTVSKLGYIGFETPDLDRLLHYYTEILDFVLVERTTNQAFLTTNFDHHSVVLTQGVLKPRSFIGYEIWEDLVDAERRLRNAGYSVELRSDMAPSISQVLVVAEPMTGTPLHLFDRQATSGVRGSMGVRPTKLGHAAAFTPDSAAMRSFYEDLLGFKWSDTIGPLVFLRCNSDHHAANFVTSATAQGLHHVAYEMRDINHLQTMLDHLAANGYHLEWGPGRHGPGHNFFTYHSDPDGNSIELFTQLDVIVDASKGYFEPRPWHNDFPQYPKTWEADAWSINSWGPQRPMPTVAVSP
jgi:catechol 2,3-dioxygenase-like lactoylglutathione lyase family enzyme